MRIEYKYCPNLSIVDTPGLLLAPSEPALRARAGWAERRGVWRRIWRRVWRRGWTRRRRRPPPQGAKLQARCRVLHQGKVSWPR